MIHCVRMSRKKPYLWSLVVWVVFVLVNVIVFEIVFDLNRVLEIAIVLNLSTFLLFGLDKFFAVHGWRRIPERILYLATLLGGSIGTLLGMHTFRHKTRKTSFQFVVAFLILIQVALLVLYLQQTGALQTSVL